MRHAKAEPAGATLDEFRPLALKGRRQATAVATMFNEMGLVPDTVWCSTALRTKQTLELVNGKLESSPHIEFRPELYTIRVQQMLQLLQGAQDLETLLVVGHEPVMSATAAYLAGEGSDQSAYQQVRIGVPTSSFMVLESTLPWQDWASHAINLTLFARPEV